MKFKVEVASLDKETQRLIEDMLKGDPKCAIPVGTTVIKTGEDIGQQVKPGTKGFVIGSKNTKIGDTYLVKFQDSPEEEIAFVLAQNIVKL